MSETFRNAYHFIPRAPLAELPEFTPSHDRYQGLSGRITCTLTLEQPTVIGGKRHGKSGDYSQLDPFLFQGQPAIPATSLKGLISSIAEAASLSRYRVLKDEALTVRDGQNPRAFPGTLHAYVDPALRPLSDAATHLSLAEQMFGFVVDKAKGEGSAYAGHIRPSIGVMTGVPETGVYDEGTAWVRLKELSQPMKGWSKANATYRSATPNFYFREKQGESTAFVGKEDFAASGANKYAIQGQKAYLHHLASTTPDSKPWKTAATADDDKKRDGARGIPAERKTKARPLAKGVEFTFTLDFDNLSAKMLALLCFALRPTPAYRHKIGYGKPIGLGSVRIDPMELALVCREKRYGEDDLFAVRQAQSENSAAIAERAQTHAEWLGQKHPTALKALLLIGETHSFSLDGKAQGENALPVLWVPLTPEKFAQRGTAKAEDRSYQWFSNNDRARAQRLRPITAEDGALPTLTTEPSPHRGGQNHPNPPPNGGSRQITQRNLNGKVASKGPNFGLIEGGEISARFDRTSAGTAMWNSVQQGDDVIFDLAGGQDSVAVNIRFDD